MVVRVTGDPAVVEVTIDHTLVRDGGAVASLAFGNRATATPVGTIGEITTGAGGGGATGMVGMQSDWPAKILLGSAIWGFAAISAWRVTPNRVAMSNIVSPALMV